VVYIRHGVRAEPIAAGAGISPVKELICFCERVDFVHLYAEQKLIFVQKLFQYTSDVLRICAYMYTMSRESASLCEKVDVYIGNFASNNVKGKIKNAVLDKFKALCSARR